jgi:hypothetical protein
MASPARVERARCALGVRAPDPPAGRWVDARNRTASRGPQSRRLTRAATSTQVEVAGIEPTFSGTQNRRLTIRHHLGASSRNRTDVSAFSERRCHQVSCRGARHRARGSNPSRRFERATTSPEVERGIQQATSLARPASDGADEWSRTTLARLRNGSSPTRATSAWLQRQGTILQSTRINSAPAHQFAFSGILETVGCRLRHTRGGPHAFASSGRVRIVIEHEARASSWIRSSESNRVGAGQSRAPQP